MDGVRRSRLGRSALSILIASLVVTAAPPTADADVPWSGQETTASPAPSATDAPSDVVATEDAASDEETSAASEPLPPEVEVAARSALDANWNDWAAHHNLAAFQTQEGDLSNAIAHATAAFAQHPDSTTTRATLLAALGDTQTVDPTLRRLTAGPWYARVPALLSPASWQRLSLLAGLVAAAGLSAMIYGMYAPRSLQSVPSGRSKQPARTGVGAFIHLPRPSPATVGRIAFVGSAAMLAVAITSWNAYGALNQPTAGILLQSANMSPVPTDLVPTEETSPVAAGTVVVTRRSFLGWQEIIRGPEASGWIRSNAVMPLYGSAR